MILSNRRTLLSAAATGATFAAASRALAQGASGNSGQPTGRDSLNLPDPAQRQGETLERGGARIFYQRTGQGGPVVLVHGYPLSGALFARVADQLARNHTVVTLDLRGYGQSHAPAVTDSVNVYAEDVLAVMDKLGLQKAVIGGMSMGGPTVLSMYKMAPARFDGLILIDTHFKNANPAEMGLWNGVAQMAEAGNQEDITQFLLPQMLTSKTRTEQMAQVQYLTAIIKPASKTALVSGAKALATRPDATEVLGTISVPTLVVVGEDDPLYGVEIAKMMQGRIRGAQLHVVPGAAHAAIFENPGDAGGAISGWMGNMGSGRR